METMEEMQRQIDSLREQNVAMRAKLLAPRRKLSLAVSEKGALSLYGLRRFPVTFYSQEWSRILAIREQIAEFITVNADKLSTKSVA